MSIKASQKKRNIQLNFTMKTNDGKQIHSLSETRLEKDLGILISNNLKWNEQAKHSAAKAYAVIGQLKRTFQYWNPGILKTLFVVFIRPHLEYAVPA